MDSFPNSLEVEKKLLCAMIIHEGRVIPEVSAILKPLDFYRTEHQIIFSALLRLFENNSPIEFLSLEDQLRKDGSLLKIDHRYLLSIIDSTFTDALALHHAKIIKEYSKLRQIGNLGALLVAETKKGTLSSSDLLALADKTFSLLEHSNSPSKSFKLADYFAHHFKINIDNLKTYATRRTGFSNIDKHQFFSPGLYVLGATPATGKTTFCWQLLEQLAKQGETCIYCSYEMSALELFTKSVARNIFLSERANSPTSTDIRCGSWTTKLDATISTLANSKDNLYVFELQDESIDELLLRLKHFCSKEHTAPVICLDYLQIVPNSKDSLKLSVDDSVRKLKKFQRDTNATFIVISSFNRSNYTQAVSFESFKESGNIEYTADVVWALQLNILNSIHFSNIADARKKIDNAKKQKPRHIQFKCLKNRQGTNYDCFFHYFSAHDCFEPCSKEQLNSPIPSWRTD